MPRKPSFLYVKVGNNAAKPRNLDPQSIVESEAKNKPIFILFHFEEFLLQFPAVLALYITRHGRWRYTMRIGLDAHGCENIGADVAGAVRALRQGSVGYAEIVLIGDEMMIGPQLRQLGWCSMDPECQLDVIHAPFRVPMDMTGRDAIKYRDCPFVVGATMLNDRSIDAFCSAGNSAAMVTATTLIAGRINGVSKPGLAVGFPNAAGGQTILADLGAMKECKPKELAELAVMAHCYWFSEFSMTSPRVGLVNIGREANKGTGVVQEADELLGKITLPDFNYIGFVEGNAILDGSCDVVICDGFVGNILLKCLEVLPILVPVLLRQQSIECDEARLGEALSGFNYEIYGGVLCLGINGTVMVTHGKASELAIANMLTRASRLVDSPVNDRIKAAFAARE